MFKRSWEWVWCSWESARTNVFAKKSHRILRMGLCLLDVMLAASVETRHIKRAIDMNSFQITYIRIHHVVDYQYFCQRRLLKSNVVPFVSMSETMISHFCKSKGTWRRCWIMIFKPIRSVLPALAPATSRHEDLSVRFDIFAASQVCIIRNKRVGKLFAQAFCSSLQMAGPLHSFKPACFYTFCAGECVRDTDFCSIPCPKQGLKTIKFTLYRTQFCLLDETTPFWRKRPCFFMVPAVRPPTVFCHESPLPQWAIPGRVWMCIRSDTTIQRCSMVWTRD